MCLKNRGFKSKTVEDRSGYLLKYTKAPCIILEPFFIDNINDLICIMDNYELFVNILKNSIKSLF